MKPVALCSPSREQVSYRILNSGGIYIVCIAPLRPEFVKCIKALISSVACDSVPLKLSNAFFLCRPLDQVHFFNLRTLEDGPTNNSMFTKALQGLTLCATQVRKQY